MINSACFCLYFPAIGTHRSPSETNGSLMRTSAATAAAIHRNDQTLFSLALRIVPKMIQTIIGSIFRCSLGGNMHTTLLRSLAGGVLRRIFTFSQGM